MNKAEELIACLEGEIAKRDEELAACRVAVENCEVFRARVAELENIVDKAWNRSHQLEHGAYIPGALDAWKRPVLQNLPYDFSGNPGTPATQYCNGWNDAGGYWKAHVDDLLAELADIKAQGVVMPDVNAAAKALCNRHAMICGVDADDQWKEYSQDFIADAETVLANARLNAAPVQQVSVPDGHSTQDKYEHFLSYSGLSDNSMLRYAYFHGADDGIEPPAAPAADAGLVDMYRHLQKVTPYRFKKIQDASITDGGDVMYYHKDRFDAALLADMAAHCAAKGLV